MFALAIALVVCWLLFYYAARLQAVLGNRLIDIASRMLGLLVVALAVRLH